jgi:hypothetical protein
MPAKLQLRYRYYLGKLVSCSMAELTEFQAHEAGEDGTPPDTITHQGAQLQDGLRLAGAGSGGAEYWRRTVA